MFVFFLCVFNCAYVYFLDMYFLLKVCRFCVCFCISCSQTQGVTRRFRDVCVCVCVSEYVF